MKKLKRKLTPIAFLLGVIIFFQGCTVYKGQNVTLDRAVEEVTKTKLVTNYGITHKFKRVEKEDGHYYGIKRTKGEIVKVPIDEKMLQSVRLRDKNLSTILTIGILVTWATGLIIGITQKSDLNHMDFNFD